MLVLVNCGFSIGDPNQHLVSVLGRNGYGTYLCGLQHEAETSGNSNTGSGCRPIRSTPRTWARRRRGS
jgi:hypothetical protein